MIPFGPLAESVPLNVTVVSYRSGLVFGIVSDERSRGSIKRFSELIEDAFDELSDRLIAGA